MAEDPKLAEKVEKTAKFVNDICNSPVEMLTVLIHVSASTLWFVVEKKTPKEAKDYVVSFCMQITKLIDANIKALVSQAGPK
jgi:hypothetical protein